MSLFDKLSSLVKKEQTEEDKLILSLEIAIKSISVAKNRFYRIFFSFHYVSYFFGPEKGHIKFKQLLSTSVDLLTKAKERISSILSRLERLRLKQPTNYRQAAKFNKNKNELFDFLLDLESFITSYIKYLNRIISLISRSRRIFSDDIYRMPDNSECAKFEKNLDGIILNLTNSILRLKAIQKKLKQNH